MSYYGSSFIFDGIPSEGYELMMYDVGLPSDSDVAFASTGTIQEEVIGKRWKPYFYGLQRGTKLQLVLTFGVNQHRIDNGQFLDRTEIAQIAAWLTGYDEYKFLSIDQEDMIGLRFKCIFTNLAIVPYGNVPWALRATVTCDSPYAYMLPEKFSQAVTDTRIFMLRNLSSLSGYYLPKVIIRLDGGNSFEVTNLSDNARSMAFFDLPDGISEIAIDCNLGLITSNTYANMYEHWNKKFLRLKRGVNKIKVTGRGSIEITCEFPVNVGG